MAVLWRLLLALAALFAADALLFRTGWYPRLLEPDSSAANVERLIQLELARQNLPAKYRVVAVGDSRMGFLARTANEHTGTAGFRFGTLALGGGLPRCWPYLLRAVDPGANRYSAIVVPLNDYDDDEADEDLAERPTDLYYLSGQLRLSDTLEFTASHTEWLTRWRVLRAMLFKGFAYQRDTQSFLAAPGARLAKVRLFRNWEQWIFDYKGQARSLAGLEIDGETRAARFPPGTPPEVRQLIERILAAAPIPRNGTMAAYRRKWLGRIVDKYRGTKTRIIFVRLPRVPLPLPARPVNPHSSVRQFAAEPHVTLVDETRFDAVSRPELFGDPWHLNAAGSEDFSIRLAEEVRRILAKS